MYQIYTLKNKADYPLIHDVVIHPFTVNRDPRGTLTEALKTTWEDVYHPQDRPFTQMYFSETGPGVARDIDQWHVHPGGQEDRFFVISGTIVSAVYDNRDSSPTKGKLNLFLMGQSQDDSGQYMLVIPKHTHHGYVVVSETKAILANFPTRLYDPKEEGRASFDKVKLPDGSKFDWQKVKTLAKDFL